MTATSSPACPVSADPADRLAACRNCSSWRIVAERVLSGLLDELDRGGGRIRLDISAERFARLMEPEEATGAEIDAGCAHLREPPLAKGIAT